MKLFLLLLVLVATALAGESASVSAQNVQNFSISSFTADYYLSRDDDNRSRLRVTEQIVAEFPDFDQNRGILRAIPGEYDGHTVDLHILGVTNQDGHAWNYTTYGENNNTVLRIGDADKFVRGEQTYNIEYTLRDATKNFEGHDEFFWDVNGTDWRQTFGSVTARVHLTTDISERFTEQLRCYTGTTGSQQADCTIETDDASGETIVTAETTRVLQTGENMSIVLGFESGTFEPYKPDPWKLALLIISGAIGLIGLPLFTLVTMWRKWHVHGRDPAGRGTIIAEYAPPKGLNPVLADVILNERMSTKAISATALALCVAGYLKLYETKQKKLIGSKTEYELELTRDPSDLSAQEQKVLDILFKSSPSVGSRVNLNEQKNKLYGKVSSLEKNACSAVAKQGYFTANPSKARKSYVGWGIALLVTGFAAAFFLFLLPVIFLGAGLIVSGIIVLLFSNVMPARTPLGVAAKEHLLGLKEYMQIAERDRIKVLQSPKGAEKTPVDPDNKAELVKLYEKLLPYAMLFGIEKDWAKQFANLYSEPPEWYSGHTSFNTGAFAGALSSFSSASASSFSAPNSSSSSGFSGGGSSGGGGGGGGGGGW